MISARLAVSASIVLAVIVAGTVTPAVTPSAARAPLRATFTGDSPERRWPLADIDPSLPDDWTPFDFLVLEFRASSSQRFDLGIETAQGRIAKRIGPLAGVWVRAAIPLRFYRDPAGSAGDLAATYNQPRGSYWINIHSTVVGPTTGVRALTVAMPDPVGSPALEVRSVSLAKTDPGDAVLDGKPLVDEFGQYVHAVWPGKARSLQDLEHAWTVEDQRLTHLPDDRCVYGGFVGNQAKATGYFRVERIDGRWWFVDPDGHLFLSAGVNGVGTVSGTRVAGREDLFAALPPADLGQAARAASFYTWNLQRRYGEVWRARWAEGATRRFAAWGFNSIHYWGPRSQAAGEEPRVPYAQMLRWQLGPSIMGMPDVYAADFERRVDESAASQLDSRARDPWMLGYFIGNEPSWPGREAQFVDVLLAAPQTEMQRRAKEHLAAGDTPERRKAFVLEAFRRYLQVVNAAVRRHAPNHLNLGIRFGGDPRVEVLEAARGFDVFSINIYSYAPPRATLDRVSALTGRPILIGEFHIGAPERGLAPGLVQAMNQEERGVAYRYYVEQAMSHPALVGTHWFQWVDQPVTGRNDGENYNIGLVDVTDRPYAELVAAATTTHQRLRGVHAGSERPFDRRPKAR
jgi:hypothetical protein